MLMVLGQWEKLRDQFWNPYIIDNLKAFKYRGLFGILGLPAVFEKPLTGTRKECMSACFGRRL
jgi:hypothetical protein